MMRSIQASFKKSANVRNKRGFTLTEVLIVIGIALFISGLTIPVGVRFFQVQTLDETAVSLMETLRRAHNHAVFQKNDSDFGVKILSDSYVLFQGDSYASRTQSEDENFILSTNIITSGIDEVVFAKSVGTPDVIGALTVTLWSDSQTIDISAQGKIERQ